MIPPETPVPPPRPAVGSPFPPHPMVRVKPRPSPEPASFRGVPVPENEARWLNLARQLLLEPTSPFHEQNIMDQVTASAQAAGLTAERDPHGNLIIDLPTTGDHDQVPLLLTAHADHPGFWAEGMIDSTTLAAHWIGRVPRDYFPGAAVRFVTSADDAGATRGSSFSLGGQAVRGRITRVTEYRGEGDYARVEIEVDGEVAPGSIGQWDLPPCEFIDGQIHATAIDDVAGVAALVCVMQELATRGANRPVRLLITRAEEAGFVGCVGFCRDQVATGNVGRAQIVGIEMSKAMPEAPVGGGPIVRVGDRRSVFDAATTADIALAAERLAQTDTDFTYQRRLMPGGTCESSVFQSTLGRSGAVCLPLGNYHNVNESRVRLDREYIDARDFLQLVRLLLAITDSPASGHDQGPLSAEWCSNLWDQHQHLLHDPVSPPKEAK